MAIQAQATCKHTQAFGRELTDLFNRYQTSYPNHGQQFLAVAAGLVGDIMALHIVSGVPESIVANVVHENQQCSLQIQMELLLERNKIAPSSGQAGSED